MSVDPSNPSDQADEILQAEKSRWPRWRNAARKAAPPWFSGKELDLLDPLERDRLYQEVRSPARSTWFSLFIVAAANLPTILRGHPSGTRQWLWIVLAIGCVLIVLGGWLGRRRGILAAARRTVRESADWPLRSGRRTPGDTPPSTFAR
jgi:hypothetical protein